MSPENTYPDFRLIFESLPDLAILLQPDLTIVAATENYLRQTMREKDIVGKKLFEIFPENPAEPNAHGLNDLQESFKKVLESGQPDTLPIIKYDVKRAKENSDGQYEKRYWRIKTFPIFDKAGAVEYLFHRVQDVTDEILFENQRDEQQRINTSLREIADHSEARLKKAEEKLLDVNLRLESAIEAGEIGTWAFEIEENRVFADKSLARIFSVSAADMEGGKLEVYLASIHPEDRTRVREIIENSIVSSEKYQAEYRILNPDNSVRWVVARGRVQRDAQGRAVQLPGVVVDITSRKESEELMRESQERFQLVTRATYDAIWDWNLTNDYVWWNEGLYTMFGYEQAEAANSAQWWYEHIHPEDRDRVVSTVHEVIDSGGEHWEAEYRFLRSDGGFKYVFDRGFVVHREGVPVRMLGAMQDITARKTVEEDLRKSQDRLQIVLEGSQVGLWYCDLPFDVLNWSERTKEHFWLPPDAVVTMNLFYARLHDEDRPKTQAAIEKSISEKSTYDIEYRTVNPATGEYKWIRAIGRGFYREDGAAYRFDGITIDITKDKNHQAEREKFLKLEQSARREVSTILERTTDGFISINRHWEFTYINPTGALMAGLDAERIIGRNIWEMFPDTLGTKYETEFKRAITQQTPVGFEELLPSAGLWLEVNAYPSEAGLSVFFRDVTVRRQIEEERRNLLENERFARAEAEKANRLKDEFLATLSHELRTPLSSILGWSRILKEKQLEGEQAKRALETIERNARAQSQLIEDILDVSRIVSGKLRLNITTVELGSIIETAIESVNPAAVAKNIKLEKNIESDGVISGDTDRLQQVIWNLISNAIKFTPGDGTVEIYLKRVNAHLELAIKDSGIGIDAENLPYIFERFRQSDSSTTRAHGGLGLGLAIVRHLVELHGGTVRAESEGIDRGSTFTVTFPLYAEVPVSANGHKESDFFAANSPSDSPAELIGLNVLLVDDEEDTRELVRFILESCRAKVKSVKNVDAALDVFGAEKFDIIISDIGMPERDGYDLIRAVRSLTAEEGGDVPAIALTAYASIEDRLKVLSAGFQMHVPKPIEPAELLAVVTSLVSWKR